MLTHGDTDRLMRAFADKYESLYGKGSAFQDAGMEIGVFRVSAIGTITRPTLARHTQSGDAAAGQREVYWRELKRFMSTPIYSGPTLAAHQNIEGPAIIELPETTIVLHPGSVGQLDEYGNFVITLL
jgi:N-methylhydantoinase A